jgi:hypothetical protein
MAHHLTKVSILRNSNYKASGIGSYVFMMQRYGKHGMKTTMPGPYSHTSQKVVKKAADGSDGEVYDSLPVCKELPPNRSLLGKQVSYMISNRQPRT